MRATCTPERGETKTAPAKHGRTVEPGLILNGRYTLVRVLGTGGMGEVWLAEDSSLERYVALKRIKPEYMNDRGHIDMFMAEAKQTAKLTHPRIVPVHDWFESEGSLWMSMVYIQGRNLSEALRSGRLPFEARHLALRDVLEGLAYLHNEGGTLHRDIKPANILLDDGNRGYITDFGIARPVLRTGDTATQPAPAGTPGYMADEIKEGAPASRASDVWAFGAVALQTYAGMLPEAGIPGHEFAGSFTPMIRDALSNDPLKRPTAKQLLIGWEIALSPSSSSATEAPTVTQSVVPAVLEEKEKRKRPAKIAAFVLAGLLALVAALFAIPAALSGGDSDAEPVAGESPSAASTPTPTATSIPTPSASRTTSPSPTAPGISTSPSVTPANLGPATYNLTDIEHTSNNFYWLRSQATIGTKPFANSIKSGAHETNTIAYGLGGACTQLKVFVGQDASSPRQAGPITFKVLLNDVEAASASVGPYEDPKELVVDLTGVVNLKLTDDRTPRHGDAVWGSPMVTCTYNPAPNN